MPDLPVRVLTVRQPWADLIAAGHKNVENRTAPFPATLLDGGWPVRIAIHAATQLDRDFARTIPTGRYSIDLGTRRRGVIVGEVDVTGGHHADECCSVGRGGESYCSPWASPDGWHWELANAEAYETPIPARGQLGLWRTEAVTVDG